MKNKNTVIKILGILFLGTLVACANCGGKPPKSTSGSDNTQPSPTPVTDITDAMILAAGTSGCEKLANLLQSLKDGKGGDVNEPEANYHNYTPLHDAVASISGPDNVAIIKILLKQGANPNAKEKQSGYTPLHLATGTNQLEILKILLAQQGVDVNAQDLTGATPLHMAAKLGRLETVQALLNCQGINKAIENSAHETALQVAQERLKTSQDRWNIDKAEEKQIQDIIQLLT